MGFWTVQRLSRNTGLALAAAIGGRGARRGGDGRDPRLPRDHAAREPDRLRARADDLRRRGRALAATSATTSTWPTSRRTTSSTRSSRPRCSTGRSSGPIVFGQNVARLRVLAARGRARLLPQPHAARAERPRGRRVAGGRRRDGHQRRPLPLRAHARRRRARRRRGRDASRSRSRRSGSTGSPGAPAGSRSRSSSSPSGGPSSASSARTSSARCRRSRPSCRRATSASARPCCGRTRCPTWRRSPSSSSSRRAAAGAGSGAPAALGVALRSRGASMAERGHRTRARGRRPSRCCAARDHASAFPGRGRRTTGSTSRRAAGEVHALLGENGAGKTHAVAHPHRALPPRRGRDPPRRASGSTSPRRAQAIDAGVCMVHQQFRLVERFTVAENLMLGDRARRGPHVSRRPRRGRAARCARSASATGSPVDPRA